MQVTIAKKQKPIESTNTLPTIWILTVSATGNIKEIDWFYKQVENIGNPLPEAPIQRS